MGRDDQDGAGCVRCGGWFPDRYSLRDGICHPCWDKQKVRDAAPELAVALRRLARLFYVDEPCREVTRSGEKLHQLPHGHFVSASSCAACEARAALAKAGVR